MPTRTPAKRSSSVGYGPGLGKLLVVVLAVGFAVHLLRGEEPAADEHAPPSNATSPAPVAPVPERAVPEPAEPSAAPEAPDPDAVARSLTRALPRGERETQRLQLLEVQGLVRNGQIGTARARASDYFERWPSGPDTAALEQLTGAHPRGDAP